jgi:hypothetical protein
MQTQRVVNGTRRQFRRWSSHIARASDVIDGQAAE